VQTRVQGFAQPEAPADVSAAGMSLIAR